MPCLREGNAVMHRITVHPSIYQRMRDLSEATGRTMTAMANEALARLVGLEGVPMDDEEIFGEPSEQENVSGTKGMPR